MSGSLTFPNGGTFTKTRIACEYWWNGSNWVAVSNTNPLPVAGSFVVNSGTIDYAAPTNVDVSSAATVVAAPGAKSTTIVNTGSVGAAAVWLNPHGGTPVINQGVPVYGGAATIFNSALVHPITGIAATGTVTLSVVLGN